MRGRLIGLNGFAKSGKDTTADMIQKWCDEHGISTARHGFADKLKESAAHALGVFEEEIAYCNALKQDGITIEVRQNGIHAGEVTGREYLQFYGTESHRDVFGSDFWVDSLLPKTEGNYGHRYEEETYDGVSSAGMAGLPDWWANFRVVRDGQVKAPPVADICLVTDVRFDNEAQRVRELGGEIWRIEREGSGAGSAGAEGHASEQMLPGELVNLVIDNNGTLEELANTVDALMEGVTSD